MRIAKSIIIGLAITIASPIITAPMAGCSVTKTTTTPERVYFESQEAFIILATNAVKAKKDGRISQSDWDTIWNPAIQRGGEMLDAMQAAYTAGDTASFDIAKASLGMVAEILRGVQ